MGCILVALFLLVMALVVKGLVTGQLLPAVDKEKERQAAARRAESEERILSAV